MTITYTTIAQNVIGNTRMNLGKVTSSSGEGTYEVQTGLRSVDLFIPTTPFVSGDLLITYPTAFPNKVDVSGYVTIVVQSGAALYWTAFGRD